VLGRAAPDVTTSSYRVAQSGPEPATDVSSSTTYQRLTFGRRERTPSINAVKVAWKTTASASAFSNR
jgi:hypothetical protein